MADPTLPVGGYAHSAGLETYVQQQVVNDPESAREFVVSMLTQNVKYTDAAFVSLAYESTERFDLEKILLLDDECTAVKLPREIREASQKLGIRLLKIFLPLTGNLITGEYREAIHANKATGHYSIAFGMLASVLKIAKADALAGYYYNAAVGMITNCVKLIPLGQLDGQQILFSLQSLIGQLVEDSLIPDESMIGFCCAGFDIRSMQHEQLYSRLYMS